MVPTMVWWVWTNCPDIVVWRGTFPGIFRIHGRSKVGPGLPLPWCPRWSRKGSYGTLICGTSGVSFAPRHTDQHATDRTNATRTILFMVGIVSRLWWNECTSVDIQIGNMCFFSFSANKLLWGLTLIRWIIFFIIVIIIKKWFIHNYSFVRSFSYFLFVVVFFKIIIGQIKKQQSTTIHNNALSILKWWIVNNKFFHFFLIFIYFFYYFNSSFFFSYISYAVF